MANKKQMLNLVKKYVAEELGTKSRMVEYVKGKSNFTFTDELSLQRYEVELQVFEFLSEMIEAGESSVKK